jgi:oligoendopeptidase F
MLDIESIRSDLEEFTSQAVEEYYLNGAGLKDKAEISKIYERFAHLFNRDIIDLVQQHAKSAQGEEERRLRFLRAFLVDDYLENRVKELSDKLLTIEAEATITVNGETMPFRQSAVQQANETNRHRRASIFAARNNVIQGLNPLLEERMLRLHRTAEELGYENYTNLFKEIKGIDLNALQRTLQPFLEKTRSLYTRKMGDFMQSRIRIALSDAEKHDVSHAFRAIEFDHYFRKEDAVDTLARTLAGMGIDLNNQKNIRLDVEERPKKSPRAFVSPIRVPHDVRLVVMPQGGHDDYATLFHEAGHAEHFGSTRPDLPVEYRYLGDNSLTEGFAFLLEYLLTNSQWLAKFTQMKDPKQFLEFVYLYKLYFLRRYIAKLSYELALHNNGLDTAPAEYREKLESSLLFSHPASHYLTDVDDGFYTANYLRAWIFEAQLKKTLVDHYGENWFEKRGAGVQLQSWWSLGQKYRAEEMLQDLGYGGLELAPLVEELTSILR